MGSPEIYALTDPDGKIRYIGKANNSQSRFKGHLRDARRRSTPVYCWITSLVSKGQVPGLVVLEVCSTRSWQDAERHHIAAHRAIGFELLNVADGGNEPACSREVRAENGRRNAKARDPKMWALKHAIGLGLRSKYISDATKAKLIRARGVL